MSRTKSPLNMRVSGLLISMLFLASLSSAATLKPWRVDHGSPVICRTENCVIALEFAAQSSSGASSVSNFPGGYHQLARATYRYRSYDYLKQTFTSGHGLVYENYNLWRTSPTNSNVEDLGSQLDLDIDGVKFGWSQRLVGKNSWLYFWSAPKILFVQQIRTTTFDSIDETFMRKYQGAENVKENKDGGITISVMGPSALAPGISSEGLRESPVIVGISVTGGVLRLSLENLPAGASYSVERSFTRDQEGWQERATIVSDKSSYEWTDQLDANVKAAFYRLKAK